MRLSRSFQIFKVIYKERYRRPTLELVIPAMLISNIFVAAFYARGLFSTYGIILSFIPLISVSETIAFSLALRNVIFVTGDHIYRGSIISFLTMPIRRSKLFLFIYFSDIILPYLFWISTTEIFILLSSIPVPSILLVTYTIGYFFAENLILLITLTFKSPGIVTLISGFALGILFIFGGIVVYYDIIYKSPYVGIASFSNPYVALLYSAITQKPTPYIITGLVIELFLGLMFLITSFIKFKNMEV